MEKPGSEEGMRFRSQMPEGKVLWNSSPQCYCYTLDHRSSSHPRPCSSPQAPENGRGWGSRPAAGGVLLVCYQGAGEQRKLPSVPKDQFLPAPASVQSLCRAPHVRVALAGASRMAQLMDVNSASSGTAPHPGEMHGSFYEERHT